MKALALLVLAGVMMIASGCAAAPARTALQHADSSSAASGVAAPAAAPVPAQPAGGQQTVATSAKTSAAPNDADRLIVRNVQMSLVVSDAAPAMDAVTKLATGAGGYVSDSNAWRDGEQLRATMTVRIPAAGLDNALIALRKLAVRVERENVTGQDVTQEYTDLNAQLTNLQATEVELRNLMSDVRQKTQKAEDVLAVYRELTTIRGEIERVKGRMQYLNNVTAMATIKLELIPDLLAKPVVEPGWRPLETLKNASRASVNAMKGVVDAAIWLVVYVVPLLIVIAVPFVALFLLVRWLIRRSRRGTPKRDLGAGAAA